MKLSTIILQAVAVVTLVTPLHASSDMSDAVPQRLRGRRKAEDSSSTASLLGTARSMNEHRSLVEDTSDDTSLLSTTATSVFTSVAESAGSDVASTLVGWAFGAVGISTGNAAALAEINGQLQDINNELSEVVTELGSINQTLTYILNDLSATKCQDALNVNTLTDSIQCIRDTYGTYSQLMTNAAAGALDFYGNQDKPELCAIGWAQNVVYGTQTSGCNGQSILAAALSVKNKFFGYGMDVDGALNTCLPYVMQEYQDSMYTSFGEWELYSTKIYPFINNFYTLQIEALEMIVEANHLLAWNILGRPKLADNSTDVQQTLSQYCNTTAWKTMNITVQQKDRLSAFCSQPTSAYQDSLDYIQPMIAYAGLPFSDSNETLLEIVGDPSSTQAQMYPRSLDAFNKMSALSGECTYPLTSSSPCGNALVDVKDSESNYKNVALSGGFSGWVPLTDMENFQRWFSSGGNETAKSQMESFGFQNLTDQIFMGETVSTPQVTVFQDGDSACYCNQGYFPEWDQIDGTMTGFIDIVLSVGQNPVVDPKTILEKSTTWMSMECSSGPPHNNGNCVKYTFANGQYIDAVRGETKDRNYFYNGSNDYSDDMNFVQAGCSGTGLQSRWDLDTSPPGYWSGTKYGNQYTMPYITIEWDNDTMCEGSKFAWSPSSSYRIVADAGSGTSMPNTRCGPTFDYMVEKYIPATPVDNELLAIAMSSSAASVAPNP